MGRSLHSLAAPVLVLAAGFLAGAAARGSESEPFSLVGVRPGSGSPRPATVDMELLSAPDPALWHGRRVAFTLDEHVTVYGDVLVARRGDLGDLVLRGRLDGSGAGWFILAGCNGAVMGEVAAPGAGHFHLRTAADGTHVIWRVEGDERLDCPGEQQPPPAGAAAQSAPPDEPGACGETIIVDVMVVYTPLSVQVIGGPDAVAALIDSYFEYTNMAYEASGVGHRMRLVHAQQVQYVESGNSITDLSRLRDPDDGFMDDVHPLRDQVGADLVSLINASGSAGTAYAMTELSVAFASSAFSAIGADTGPIPGGLIFAHETGHNMGCHHNHTANPPDALFCYSYGHRTADQQWRTIMSSSPGTFVDVFSSPDLEIDGQALGVPGDGCPSDAAHNVRSLNEAAATVARFRPTMIPLQCPGDANGDGAVNVEDLVLVILNWGPCGGAGPCPADLNDDGTVDVLDLIAVVLNWG